MNTIAYHWNNHSLTLVVPIRAARVSNRIRYVSELMKRCSKLAGSPKRLCLRLLQQVPVIVGVQAEAVHQPRQVGAQGLGSVADPGDYHGFHAYAVLAVVLGNGFGGAAELRLGLIANGVRSLGQDLVE